MYVYTEYSVAISQAKASAPVVNMLIQFVQ